jgi:hypothetical protein
MIRGVTESWALRQELYEARRDIGLLQVALAARANDLDDPERVAVASAQGVTRRARIGADALVALVAAVQGEKRMARIK